jgi:4-alpha-glucanotransferase
VRASLMRLGIPGYRVLRWERRWHEPGQPFIDPTSYPSVSVATSGTHDTEPLAIWWTSAPEDERLAVSALPTVQRLAGGSAADEPWSARLRDVFIEALYASGSDLVLLPVGDVFGWADRINDPANMSDDNWRFMLPWRVDSLGDQPEARERQTALSAWSQRWDR